MNTTNSWTKSASTALGTFRNLIASASAIALVVASLSTGLFVSSPALAKQATKAECEKYFDAAVGAQNLTDQIALFQMGVDAGCTSSMDNLASLYASNPNISGKTREAFDLWTRCAKLGSPSCARQLDNPRFSVYKK